jgi:hypothetical protein
MRRRASSSTPYFPTNSLQRARQLPRDSFKSALTAFSRADEVDIKNQTHQMPKTFMDEQNGLASYIMIIA